MPVCVYKLPESLFCQLDTQDLLVLLPLQQLLNHGFVIFARIKKSWRHQWYISLLCFIYASHYFQTPECLLCPKLRPRPNPLSPGPLPDSYLRACKPTEGQGWAHLICAVFIPELAFTDCNNLKVVEGVSALSSHRWTTVSGVANWLNDADSCFRDAVYVIRRMVPSSAAMIVIGSSMCRVHGTMATNLGSRFNQ